MPKYVLKDAEIKLTGIYQRRNIPSHSDLFVTKMKRITVSSYSKRRQHIFLHWILPISIKKEVGRAILQMAKIKKFWGTTEDAVRI